MHHSARTFRAVKEEPVLAFRRFQIGVNRTPNQVGNLQSGSRREFPKTRPLRLGQMYVGSFHGFIRVCRIGTRYL